MLKTDFVKKLLEGGGADASTKEALEHDIKTVFNGDLEYAVQHYDHCAGY